MCFQKPVESKFAEWWSRERTKSEPNAYFHSCDDAGGRFLYTCPFGQHSLLLLLESLGGKRMCQKYGILKEQSR